MDLPLEPVRRSERTDLLPLNDCVPKARGLPRWGRARHARSARYPVGRRSAHAERCAAAPLASSTQAYVQQPSSYRVAKTRSGDLCRRLRNSPAWQQPTVTRESTWYLKQDRRSADGASFCRFDPAVRFGRARQDELRGWTENSRTLIAGVSVDAWLTSTPHSPAASTPAAPRPTPTASRLSSAARTSSRAASTVAVAAAAKARSTARPLGSCPNRVLDPAAPWSSQIISSLP